MKFQPEDFGPITAFLSRTEVAALCNAKLAELLKDAVKVYGRKKDAEWEYVTWPTAGYDTHTALLIGITELEKPNAECVHSAAVNTTDGVPCGFYCLKCSAKLKPNWSEV